jgi:MFS family permease
MAPRYRWVILAVSVIAFLQTHLHRLAFAPLIPTFVGDLGLSYAAAGTIQTAYFWTYTAMQVPVGVVADRWGVRRVMVTCMAVLAIGAAAFGASGGFASSVVARMIVGLGASAVWVPAMRLVGEWFPPEERAAVTGMISAGGGLGGTLGFLLIPWLASWWGWRLAYGATAVPAILTLVLIAWCVRPGPRAAVAVGSRGGLGRVLATRELWPFNLLVFFSYGAYFSVITFLPAFLVTVHGATRPQAGLVTGLITAGTIVSWPLAGWLSDRAGRRKPFTVLSQAAAGLGFLVFAFVTPHLSLVATGFVAALLGLLIGGMILPFVMVVELTSPELAATVSGVTNGACFVGAMILPIVLGRIVDVTGGFGGAFTLAAGLEALALLCCIPLRETGRSTGAAFAVRS